MEKKINELNFNHSKSIENNSLLKASLTESNGILLKDITY
jgi:hypothetical protein